MKSILVGPKEEKEEKVMYPYLGICKNHGYVVLFAAKDAGTLVHDPTGHYTVGHHSTNWAEKSVFIRLKGKITLHN